MADNDFNAFGQGDDGDDIDPIDMIGSDLDSDLLDETTDTISSSDEIHSSFDVIAPYESYDLNTDAYHFDGVAGHDTQDIGRKRSSVHDGPNPFIVAALVFSLIGGAGFVVWRLFTSHVNNQGAEISRQTSSTDDEQGASEQQWVRSSLQGKDIMAIISEGFAHNGQDLSLSTNRLGVQIRDGSVVVTHTLEAGAKMIPESLVRNAGLRANALAAKLTGTLVGGGDGALFQRLTWIVRDAKGKAYLATIEGPGEVRVSDETFGVLASSQGYVIAPDILRALGDNSGLTVRSGEQPTDLDGFAIAANAQYGTHTTETKTDANTQTAQPSEQKDSDSKKESSKKKDEKKKKKTDEKKEEKSDSNKNTSDKSNSSSGAGGSESGDKNTGGDAGGSTGGNAGGNTGGDDGGDSGGSPGGETGGDPVDPGGGSTEPTPDPEPEPPTSDPTPQPDPSDGDTPDE